MAVRSLRFERNMGGSPWLVLLLGLHGGRGVSNPAGGKHDHLERLRRAPVPLRLSVPKASISACAPMVLSFPYPDLSTQSSRQHPFSHSCRSLRSTPSSRTLVLARASAAVPAALDNIETSCIPHVFVFFRSRSLLFPTLHQHSHS